MKNQRMTHWLKSAVFGAMIATIVAFAPSLCAQTTADEAAQQALGLFNDGKTADAIAAYEKILKDYPTSAVVSEAQFRLGYLYFQNGDLDKAADLLKKTLQPPASPEVQQLGYSLLPQVMAAKASKLAPDDPNRKSGFEEAIRQYDVFIQKYPNADEMESMVYSRALSLYQLGKYNEAGDALRSNITKFNKSESLLDNQYMLAITLAAQAATMLVATPGDQAAFARFDEAEKVLRDITLNNTDIALANDAQFELGEVLYSRSGFAGSAEQPAVRAKAVEAYRAVQAREPMLKAQQDRIDGIQRTMRDTSVTKTITDIKHYQRWLDRERGKLAALKVKADLTVTARIKVAQVFYDQHRYDEARQMLHDLQQFAEDDTQKKTILYYVVLTYAAQNITDKAVAGYNEFKEKYSNDPIADNLPLVIGTMFLSSDPKINDPEKAASYFKEEETSYPKGRFVTETLTQKATVLVQLKRFDEALGVFKSLLAGNPGKEIAAAAQVGIGSIYSQTGKLDEALAAYKEALAKYPGTPAAEQAAFYSGQIAVQKGDNKTGVAELGDFVEKHPASPLLPSAMYYLATGEQASGDNEAALAKFKDLSEKFPGEEAAQYAYFQRAGIYAADQKADEMAAVLKEFISKYPDSDKAFFAYDSIGQSQINAGKPEEAIGTYNEFMEKHPHAPQVAEALLKLGDLWRGTAESQGRYLMLNEDQRAVWTKGVNESIAAEEKLLEQFPDSPNFARALQTLIADQRLLLTAKLKSDAEVRQYFQTLETRFQDKPSVKSRVLFAEASYLYDQDKKAAFEQMKAAYDPTVLYTAADMDLYGSSLIEQNNIAEAQKIYAKLAADYPNPPGVTPDKAPAQIADAQATSIYGLGKCLQKQGNTAAAGEAFDKLKKLYPWSPKILEADFGIAQSLYEQKKYDDAIALVVPIIRAQSDSATVELRANAMLLGGKIQEAKGNMEAAIDYFMKIAYFYEGVPTAAAEGLWNGAQLLEKQAAGLSETGKVTKSGQLAKAAKAYKDLGEKYPTSPYAEQARLHASALRPSK